MIILFTFSIYSNSQTVQRKFIDKYDSLAITLSNEYKIPPSVILGVSMLESGSGTSKLSRNKHNFFGIKSGNYYRGYENDSASFRHFCTIIAKRKYYSQLVINNVKDYKIWLYKIQSGGYSATKTWANRIIILVKYHKLDKLDI